MRKSLTLIAIVCMGLSASAQLTRAEIADVGDAQVYRKADTTGVTVGPSGTGQVWNYSSMVATSVVGTNRFVDPTTHAQGVNYPTSNLCFNPSNGVYAFYTATADSLYLIGEKSPANTAVTYTDGAAWLRFPQAYSVPNEDSIIGQYPDGFISNVTRRGYIRSIFDGDGSLSTPFATYPSVKRVEYFGQYADSSWTGALDAEVYVLRYEWFAAGETMPVLIIHQQEVIINGGNPQKSKEIWWADPTAVGVDAPAANNMTLAPNPSRGASQLSYTLDGAQDVRVEVLDLLGGRVSLLVDGLQAGGQHELQLGQDLASGMYLVRVQTAAGSSTQKLVIE